MIMTDLGMIFGPEVAGLPVEEAASKSRQRFVRGKDELGLYDEYRHPTGHVLTAWEAYQDYGLDILSEAVEHGSAILIVSRGAIENALRRQRERLGLTLDSVAQGAGIDRANVEKAESHTRDIPIATLERIAFRLGLNEKLLAFHENAGADEDLGVRLKTLQYARSELPSLSAGTVLGFAEAASIVRVQSRLQEWLGLRTLSQEFETSADYGSSVNPAWRVGYRLAGEARSRLQLGEAPVESMRELIEETLGIPVIQVRLPEFIAGATIATQNSQGGSVRGVVLNTVGDNSNVWVRRATLAHELCHLLYDPADRLENLRVDSYVRNSSDPQSADSDYIEQRANAFAIAFLAPLEQVRRMVEPPIQSEAVAQVMQTFGISYTAARYHVVNAHYRSYSLPQGSEDAEPTDEQLAAEDFAIDYFRPERTPISRRGRFSGLVAACYDRGYISEDTAAVYLGCTSTEFLDNLGHIRDIHPIALQK
jgi:transcriptional regulator with XRE-family HTH domain